jgi:PTH1 family peptidyl-tRNA hydrolase
MRAEVAEVRIGDHAVVLTLPRTFMNESGQAVAPLVKYFHVDTDRLLVVHDDIDLPLGRLRVQGGRGHGGNNGVRSVVGSLGTRDFWRLRCGVGRPPGSQDPADYVLRPFAVKEREEAALVVEHACDLAELFVAEGGEAARQRAGELGPDRP